MKGRYSKKWWRGLNKDERRVLVGIMTARIVSYGGGGYLPDDCSECGACGEPMLGMGLCLLCYKRYSTLHDKADQVFKSARQADGD